MSEKEEAGFFQKALTFIGFFFGLSAGSSVEEPNFFVVIFCAFIFGGIGAFIGQAADKLVAFLVALAAIILSILINSAIRNFVLGILFGSA